ncbi:MAG: DNA polymerase III subunit beta [Paramuribaculum sp.]|nr:DNA polymerase III subunit beta [Paramuribaculum sp.]
MKFNISSKTLYNYVSSVSKVINTKNTMQILSNFLFTLDGDSLTVKAADMENFLEGRMMVTGAEGSGRFCLDARRLVELLKEMPDQGITFNINDDNYEVEIDYGTGRYKTMAINGLEYPDSQNPDSDTEKIEFTCSTEQVLKGIENTLFAVGNDQLRPQMMGILWDVKPEELIFVATDTRKLVKYVNATTKPGVTCSFILPVKGAMVLKNVFGRDDEIKVTVRSTTSVMFESESFTFDCRLIKGNFPDYNRVIPVTNPYIFTVDRSTFLNAVRRVAVFGDEGGGLVKFKFSTDEVTLRASDNSFGTSGWEQVPCNYSGNDLLIGFGSEYLIEILSTFSTTDIVIKLADPSRPALCLPAENEPDCELLMILMPMNIID